ncbi:MAG: radical SAM protein [Gemmataceae bacterium]
MLSVQRLPREAFVRERSHFTPAYLQLDRTCWRQRVERALEELRCCRVCPRHCDVDRLHDRVGVCRTGRYAYVSSFFPHFGEEDGLRGWKGSGTIFFAYCNLKCVFCQNFDISWKAQDSVPCTAEDLARMMLALQRRGCHNINLVTPEHVVPQIIEAIPLAVDMGLRLPIVYNTSSYDSATSLELLDGIVDIYMPDFKFWDRQQARRLVAAEDYPDVARERIKEMHRQVGPLTFDEEGLALRGVLVRHLVMPGHLEETRHIMHFLAREVSPHTYVNIMGQYYPAGRVLDQPQRYAEINRRITQQELHEAYRAAREAGLYRFDSRWLV